MNKRIIFLIMLSFLTISGIQAQDKNKPKSIISPANVLKKYHELKELETMQKGQLLELYVERINVLFSTLPFAALTTTPGVNMTQVGIPVTNDNKKAFDVQQENTSKYIKSVVDFQNKIMPYADKQNLITSILFFEATLKECQLIYEQ
jgi:hypothetical protein